MTLEIYNRAGDKGLIDLFSDPLSKLILMHRMLFKFNIKLRIKVPPIWFSEHLTCFKHSIEMSLGLSY